MPPEIELVRRPASHGFLARGVIRGTITRVPSGGGGFGYDPVFYFPEFDQTLAEVSAAQKHTVSHRGRAARAAIPLIEAYLQQ